MRPWRPSERGAVAGAAVSAAAWLAFVGFTPPASDAEIAARLTPGGGEVVHHAPTLVAGRWHGAFGAVNAGDRLLTIVAAEAVDVAQLVADPDLSTTRGESWRVAALAFALSTAVWTLLGAVFGALLRPRSQPGADAAP